ncbi:UDP-glucose dehydrogenase family protein [Agromyces arachidis]|uniref:UDP-glucose dehydrogenase family protein n=1 Tax=Agromyces arachidis TaxID=766966 RepID=UPI004055BA6D
MKISVIGCGYLGAVHAAAMAKLGHDVVGIDTDASKVAKLTAGTAPFFEPGLDELLREGIESGRLRFTTDIAEASDARVHFVAVGTPQLPNADGADLRFVDGAFDALAGAATAGSLIVGKSTVPVGTAADLVRRIREAGCDALVAWNPEFLREGFAVADTLTPDRLVYGVDDAHATKMLDEVYADILERGTPRIVTDFATAELVKTAANAFLATKISFINAMAEIAETTGADVTTLADAIGHDARIGRRFLNAGIGFGGGCLPKDIRAFTARAEELGRAESVAFLRQVDAINLRRRERAVELAIELLGGSAFERRVAVLGLTFKPDSDDVRDSPALDVAARLHGLGAEVVATDPHGIENARLRHPQLHYVGSAGEAVAGADLAMLVTEWGDYRSLDPLLVAASMATPRIIDARNVLDARAWRDAGFEFRALGRT